MELKEVFRYKNPMQLPRILKVVVSSGIGSIKDERKRELVGERLSEITGQKAAPRGAKQAIATFKSRQGDKIGYQVTLRGQRMYDFLERLLRIALPRTKDFRGLPPEAIDEMGNYTIGIREHTIFPETSDEELRDVFGMAITIVLSTRNRDEARKFLEYIGLPFKKTQGTTKNP